MTQRCESLEALENARSALSGSVGFVPTMGALHAGHLALVEVAKARCDFVVVSIFVNPKQFGPHEDYARYPRNLSEDIAALEARGVDVVFAPGPEVVYPPGFATHVEVPGLDAVLCGARRPGHFAGVATVVARFFALVRPDISFFGEKDYQQLRIVERMNADLPLSGAIAGVPTVREADGLAASSRNQSLSAEERRVAPALYRVLRHVQRQCHAAPLPELIAAGVQSLREAGMDAVEYLEARDAATLAPAETPEGARLFAAVWLGQTRLIDNVALAAGAPV